MKNNQIKGDGGMERSFILCDDCEFVLDHELALRQENHRRDVIIKFFKEKGILAKRYYVRGDGLCNCSFEEWNKNKIKLYIDPTDDDIKNFGSLLTKPSSNVDGLCSFKRNSHIAKEFADLCVKEKVIINVWHPRVNDYFESTKYKGCSRTFFKLDDTYYLKITSDSLDENETPKGYTEINLSTFYLALEKYKGQVG